VSEITPNPAFLLKHPTLDVVYASTECIHAEGCGDVVTLALDPATGSLVEQARTSAGGRSTCYLTLHRPQAPEAGEAEADKTKAPPLVLAAVNYWDAIVAVLPVAADTGLAGAVAHAHMQPGAQYVFDEVPDRVEHWAHRQKWPHTHCFVSEPCYPGGGGGGGPSAVHLVPDLGADVVWAYRLTGAAGLTLQQCGGVQLEPRQGPRHLVFHPAHRVAYVINELKSTVSCLEYHPGRVPLATPAGAASPHNATLRDASADPATSFLVHAQTLRTLPVGFDSSDHHKSHASEIRVHPSGNWLLIANRGHDSLACYAIDPANGWLTLAHISPSGGAFPRNFNFDATGRWVVVGNQNSNCLTVFAFDVDGDGALTEVDSKPQPSPNFIYALPQAVVAPSPRSAAAFRNKASVHQASASQELSALARASSTTSSLGGSSLDGGSSGSSLDGSPPGSPTGGSPTNGSHTRF
jgi:6-phosphogluconolactonase (cycloisomerase 2 family)